MRRKVLHVINSLTAGGAEALLVNSLAPGGLQEHTDNIVVYFQGTSVLEDRIDKQVPAYSLQYNGLKSLPATLRKLKKIIKDNNIDIVHTHLNPAGVYTHLICKVPQVHTMHTTYSMDKETLPSKLLMERKFYLEKKNCNLIFLSAYTKEDFLKTVHFKGRPFVLNNFIPDIYFTGQEKKYKNAAVSLKIIAVGRLTEGKNFQYLLSVFEYLKDINVQLDIYGKGDIESYEKEITNKQLKIRMMGHCDNLPRVLPQYDLFIMPSKFEGFPLSVFEAMATGLPLILSDIAPVKSVVKDHALYFPLDDANTTAEMIRAIFAGRIAIDRMSTAGILYAEKMVRKELYVKNLLAIYHQVLDKKQIV